MQEDGESDEQYEARVYAAIEDAYGETAYYNAVDSKVGDFFDPRRRIENIKRFCLNAITEADDAWLKITEWNDVGLKNRVKLLLKSGEKLAWRPPARGEKITHGFEGS